MLCKLLLLCIMYWFYLYFILALLFQVPPAPTNTYDLQLVELADGEG